MSPQARWEYMKTVYERYQQAKGKREKGLILTEFTKTYGCHRKSALRILNGLPPGAERPARRSRGSDYDSPRLLRTVLDDLVAEFYPDLRDFVARNSERWFRRHDQLFYKHDRCGLYSIEYANAAKKFPRNGYQE